MPAAIVNTSAQRHLGPPRPGNTDAAWITTSPRTLVLKSRVSKDHPLGEEGSSEVAPMCSGRAAA